MYVFRDGKDVNQQPVRELLGDAFCLIRFKQTRPVEFEEVPAKSEYPFEEVSITFSSEKLLPVYASRRRSCFCFALPASGRFDSSARNEAVSDFIPRESVQEGSGTRFVQSSLC